MRIIPPLCPEEIEFLCWRLFPRFYRDMPGAVSFWAWPAEKQGTGANATIRCDAMLPEFPKGEAGQPCMAGNIWRIIVMAAGPTRMTKMPGKMKITSGKMSFTAVLAAFSSAS